MGTYEADPKLYKQLTVIGRSGSGISTISLAKHLPSGKNIAIRRIHLERVKDDLQELKEEFLLSRQLEHPNILKFHCCFVHNLEIWEVMPLMAFGSCKDLMHAHFTSGLPEPAIAYIMRDLLQALEYIHQRGVIHRSVRASHILVSATGQACLTGLTNCIDMVVDGKKLAVVHAYLKDPLQAINWLAPEVLKQDLLGYSTNSDIYSLGITACELANGQEPFADMQPTQMFLEKMYGMIPQLMDSTTLENLMEDNAEACNGDLNSLYKRTFSNQFHHFVGLCTQYDPKYRASASTLLGHNFLKQIKRRSSDSLPQLLYPVSPVTDIANLPTDDTEFDELEEQCQSMQLDDANWEFD